MGNEVIGYNSVVIPAAGCGKRMGANISKQYLEIGGKPIIAHTIEKFSECNLINEIVVVTAKNDIEFFKKEILRKYTFNKNLKLVIGGKERQESVYNGLKSVSSKADIVLIHDGARPFISIEDIKSSIQGAKKYDACIIAVKVKDTIKMSDEDGYIESTPKRDQLWAVQTPQTFKTSIILEAHEKAVKEGFLGTDDAMLVERLGYPIKILEGRYQNIKITTPEDLSIGEVIYNSQMLYE